MGKTLFAGLGVFIIGLIAAAIWLWTPAPTPFDREAAIEAAQDYDARIIRDRFGVPHIYGVSDADAAFGLGYAHAEDDWATFEDVIFFSRGALAQRNGKAGAVTDYLLATLGVSRVVEEKYEQDLTPATRALVEGYAAGINLWCAEEVGRCAPGAAPVTGQDIIAGFVARTPFFYGFDQNLRALFEGEAEKQAALNTVRQAFLRLPPNVEAGSNAMAVAPSRSDDGHTRLMVNSHQPYEGPVAWYEARLKSEAGWDMIGGLFPGAPIILVGAGPTLGWAHTVNKPDLFDAYKLTVDNEKRPTKYLFDEEWRDLDIDVAKFRVKLFGPFSLPVTRKTYRSVHGPVFLTDHGVYAIAYGGMGDIRAAEQWYRMNKARDFEEWKSAMEMSAIPSFNAVYADRTGNIAYYYNVAIPVRAYGYDWDGVLPGDTSKTLWKGMRPFSVVPQVLNPASGYVVNANHSPFAASGEGDNPNPADFPPHFGVKERHTNRGIRIQELYGGDPEISEDEFLAYKMDYTYARGSRVMETVEALIEGHEPGDALLDDAVRVLKEWDRTAAPDSRGAGLALLTAQKARGYLLDDIGERASDYQTALRDVAEALKANFGRLDPEWRDVMRFRRGDMDVEIDGGPDALRAAWPSGDIADGPVRAAGGDTYILYADWPENGGQPEIHTIHQFGAATLDETSPHFADQAPLFLAGEWKQPPMALDEVLAEATRDYRPGR